jgi:two-component sensor histidine kinase
MRLLRPVRVDGWRHPGGLDHGTRPQDLIPSAKAVSLGLIVTGLVINALKHTFPPEVIVALGSN